MILGQLKLINFSAFGGTHTIDFAPKDSEHPIILVGGLNGAGKTSLLTAVRLALFGKRIIQLDKSLPNYTQLLRELAYDRAQGATSITLHFDTYSLGERDRYTVTRSWVMEPSGKPSESFMVWRNSELDTVLATTWDDFVDSLIPASIANLFFFDGETVADLANPEGAQKLLRIGIQSLLGIDLLARLREDLADLIHKKAKGRNDSDLHDKLNSLEEDLTNLRKQQTEFEKQEREHVTRAEALRIELEEAETQLKENGADLFLQRSELEQSLDQAKQEQEALKAELVKVAEGPLPFSVIPDLLDAIRNQDHREQQAVQASAVLGVLEERDSEVLNLLEQKEASTAALLRDFFEKDRTHRLDQARASIYLNLSDESRESLAQLDGIIAEDKSHAQELTSQLGIVEETIHATERKLAMVPPQEVVAEAIANRESLLNSQKKLEESRESLRRKQEQLAGAIAFREAERERALKRLSVSQAKTNIDGRIIQYAQRARERVEAFSSSVLQQSTAHLEELILHSINLLFRKAEFIGRVTVDTNDFRLSLYDCSGTYIPLGRLSAGERQLVIIAILWGLGQASGRPLPIIVDTPLGRLDSYHRVNLLENYFPNVSHQVILLSTDTEITQETKKLITPYLSKSYQLTHNTRRRLTSISEGYFGTQS